MSRQIKKRIFVVEQSARGLGGHHLEYALRISETAIEFEKHLVVSSKFKSKVDYDQAVIHPNYKYGYWDLPGKELIKFLLAVPKDYVETFEKIISSFYPGAVIDEIPQPKLVEA